MGSTIAAKTGIPGAEGLMQGLAMGLNDSSMNPSSALPQMIENRRGEARDAKQRNMTAEYIRKMGHDDLAGLVENGGLTAAQALAYAKEKGGDDDWQIMQSGGDIVAVNRRTREVQDLRKGAAGAGGSKMGLNANWARGKDGKYRLVYASEDGSLTAPTLPPDIAELLPPTQQFSTGTESMARSTRGGDVIPGTSVPIDNAGAEQQKVMGKTIGEVIAAAPSTIIAADKALADLEAIRDDPDRESATGTSSVFNNLPGFLGNRGFEGRVAEAKAGGFLTAIKQLQGLGALSDAEGQTATAAVNRMETGMEEGDFLEALDDYKRYVEAARARAVAIANGTLSPLDPGAPDQIAVGGGAPAQAPVQAPAGGAIPPDRKRELLEMYGKK